VCQTAEISAFVSVNGIYVVNAQVKQFIYAH